MLKPDMLSYLFTLISGTHDLGLEIFYIESHWISLGENLYTNLSKAHTKNKRK